jgi:cytochrome P450
MRDRRPGATARRVFAALAGPGAKALIDLPGPAPTPGIGNLRLMKEEPRPWRLFARLRDNHGGLCVFWVGPRPVVVVQDPALIEQVLVDRELDFFKQRPLDELGPVLTVSSLASNRRHAPTDRKVGEWEERVRRSPLRFLHGDVGGRPWFEAQIEPVHDVVVRTVQTLRDQDEDFDLRDVMRRLTWDVLSVQAVGRVFTEPDEDRYGEFWAIVAEGDRRLKAKFGLPRLSERFEIAFGEWARTFGHLVDDARLRPRPDAVDLLSAAVAGGVELSDRDLALEIGNVWFGGQMGIASLLVTALTLLHRHPRVKAELVDELLRELGDRGPYSLSELSACALLDGVVREAHRLLPAVPLFFRNASRFEPVELGGYELPPGTELLINSFGVHRDRDHWPFPEHFRPDRWQDDATRDANRYGSAFFFPYGRGQRACGGAALAVSTIKMVLATLLREGGVEVVNPFTFEEDYFATVLSYRWLRARIGEPL